jgi:hypothetical protein
MRSRLLHIAAAMICSALAAQQDDLSDGWRFAAGSVRETLQSTAKDGPPLTERVRLPHRVLRPNTALWYARTIFFPAGGALAVAADDGAQAFVNGVRWEQDQRVFYPPTPVAAGAHEVVIRVLNNAMEGGLRRVSVVDPPADRPPPELPALPPGFDAVESVDFRNRMPGPSVPCDFTLWADSQGEWQRFAELVSRMAARPHHFSAGIGDLVNDGSNPAAWREFVGALTPLAARVAIVPIAGNHDYDGFYNDLVSRWYERLFSRHATWMSWSCGPARFAAIDLNREFPIGISPGSAQHTWLQREVRSREWRDATWKVLLVHQPPYSRSWAGYDGDEAVRSIVQDLVEHHGLQLVVSGHSHAYEHLVREIAGRPLHVLITGGAGGGLEAPMTPPAASADRMILEHHFIRARAGMNALSVEAIDRDGRILDGWAIPTSQR